jgi:hypothetical protein
VKWRTNLENHPTINPELAEIKLSSVNAWTRKDTKGRNMGVLYTRNHQLLKENNMKAAFNRESEWCGANGFKIS